MCATVGEGSAVLRWLIALCTLLLSMNAWALTLEDVAQVYQQKQETLGTYRLKYREEWEATESDGSMLPVRNVVVLLTDGVRFRKEWMPEVSPDGTPRSIYTTVWDGEDHRRLSSNEAGRLYSGSVLEPLSPSQAYSANNFSPVNLAGLHDSSSYWQPGAGGLQPFMTDIRALARDPESRLLPEQVQLDGEKAYVIEQGEANAVRLRVWLSAEKNLNLLKYESYIHDQSGNWTPMHSVTNSEYSEVEPGLWLPGKSESRNLNEKWAADNPGIIQLQTFEFLSLETQVQTTDDDFRIAFPPGLMINNQAGLGTYLQKPLRALREVAQDITGRSGVVVAFAIILVFVILSIIMVVKLFRRRKGKSA
jgi:hypothetical protein